MNVILCHTTADFDTLGAAVGLALLNPGARIVLTGGAHPGVQQFLAFHRDEFPLIEARSVDVESLQRVMLVDAQQPERFGRCAGWLEKPGLSIELYDHHPPQANAVPAQFVQIEPVGSTSTLITEKLQAAGIIPSVFEATVLALGVHVDTGSLTYAASTARDARVLAWLMEQGIKLQVLSEFIQPGLSQPLQQLLITSLELLETAECRGQTIGTVALDLEHYVEGLSTVATYLLELQRLDVMLFAARYENKTQVIGRARAREANLHTLLEPYGGGGHPQAAAATIKDYEPHQLLTRLRTDLCAQLPVAPVARELMSTPVRTIRPECTIDAARRILLRYGHSGLTVVDSTGELLGIISGRDLDIALHHGFGHAPVKGYMTRQVRTITPETSLSEIQDLMVTYDIGRLPVLDRGTLVGIVTRTDVLRQIHQTTTGPDVPVLTREPVRTHLQEHLSPHLLKVLQTAADLAEVNGLTVYLVGGAVRDVLLGRVTTDIDLVVEGHFPGPDGAGVELARALQARYPETRLDIHGKYKTASLLWPDHTYIDLATARTEFYLFPGASPEVEPSSIRQDLYRRDFTINAMAVRLNGRWAWQLLDFFGGLVDLRAGLVRVLHPNSFIEDPTRIYRAVRFAVRLGFTIEPHTEASIANAVANGLHDAVGGDRLKTELHYILEAPYWLTALRTLAYLDALRCIHPDLQLTPSLVRRLRWLSLACRRHTSLLPTWQLRLEAMLLSLQADACTTAEKLRLEGQSLVRLQSLPGRQRDLQELLAAKPSVLDLYEHLQGLKPEDLLLLGSLASRRERRQVYDYLVLERAEPLISGHDLKELGLAPGPRYREILTAVRREQLTGALSTADEARTWVRTHCFLPEQPS
ncbi:MAG: CBS domain-containing protein [Gemmatimonadaceae bacterium]|nr:CBS domain-containing protein [Gloeobacterales cyanobacterium ES-bin-141]